MIYLKDNLSREELESVGFTIKTNLTPEEYYDIQRGILNKKEIIESIVYYLKDDIDSEEYPLLVINPNDRKIHLPSESQKYESEFLDLLFTLFENGFIEKKVESLSFGSLFYNISPNYSLSYKEIPEYSNWFVMNWQKSTKDSIFFDMFLPVTYFERVMKLSNIDSLSSNIYITQNKTLRQDICLCVFAEKQFERKLFDKDKLYSDVLDKIEQNSYTQISVDGLYMTYIDGIEVEFLYWFVSEWFDLL